MVHHTSLGISLILLLTAPFSIVCAAPLSDAYIHVNAANTAARGLNEDWAFHVERFGMAVRYAIDSINADPDILPNTTLHFDPFDNLEDVNLAMSGLVDSYNEHGNAIVLAMVGVADYILGPVSNLAAGLGLPAMVLTGQDTIYSDRSIYPNNFRLTADGAKYGNAFGEMFDHFGWHRVAYLHERGQAELQDMEDTPFFDRDVQVFTVSFSPDVAELVATISKVVAAEFTVMFVSVEVPTYIQLLVVLEQMGVRTQLQVVTDSILSSLGVEVLAETYGVPRDYMAGTVGVRMREEFTSLEYLTFAQQYMTWYVSNPYPDRKLITGTLDDFSRLPVRIFEANSFDAVYMIARAVHEAFEEGVDGADINGTVILERIYNRESQGVFMNHTMDERGENVNFEYNYVNYNAAAGYMVSVGSWTHTNGLHLTEDVAFVTGTSTAPADAYPPDAVAVSSISTKNVTTTSFVLEWDEPDLHSGRDVYYTVLMALPLESLEVVGNTTSPYLLIAGLAVDQMYTLRVDVTSNGGYSQGGEGSATTNRNVETLDIDLHYVYPVLGFMSLLAVFSIALQVLVFYNRKDPVMKASSVIFMDIILIGSLGAYIGVATAGFHPSACTATPILLSVSFMLIFGSLFAKTWRVAHIFLSKLIRVKTIPDSLLLRIVVGLVGWEIAVHIVWFSIDMPKAVRVQDEADPFVLRWTCHTENPDIWWIMELVPKFLLLCYGSFLAYRTRNIHETFNESRFIAFSLWNTFLFLIIGLVLRAVADDPSATFLVLSLSVFVIVGSTVGILFMPKVVAMVSGISNDIVTGTTGVFVTPGPGKSRNGLSNSMQSSGDARVSNHPSFDATVPPSSPVAKQ